MQYGKPVADWNPGPGKGRDLGKEAKLMSTEAHDVAENINGTNELVPFENGKKGVPKGPFGPRGHGF